jgi:hypothetical protein
MKIERFIDSEVSVSDNSFSYRSITGTINLGIFTKNK